MLSIPFDPVVFVCMDKFLRVKSLRGKKHFYERNEYKKARTEFFNEVVSLEKAKKIIDVGVFVRAVYFLLKNPKFYEARHSYMTRYQILKLVSQAGAVNSKKLVKVFDRTNDSRPRQLLEIDKFLHQASGGTPYTKSVFETLEMFYY